MYYIMYNREIPKFGFYSSAQNYREQIPKRESTKQAAAAKEDKILPQ